MIAKNLRYLRKKYKETQQELCKILNIAQNTLSDYENGKHPIPDSAARDIAYHYRITLYELLSTDISTNDASPIPDKNLILGALNAIFPIIQSPLSSDDLEFEKAYEITMLLRARIGAGQKIDLDEIIDCLVLFRVSWEKYKNISAIANYISLILFLCTTHSESDELFFTAILEAKPLNYLDIKKVVLRDRPSTAKQDEHIKNRKSYVHDHEDQIIEYIKHLKAAPDYFELADYYIACMYFVGFVDNDFDLETNQRIALELLIQLCKLENRYALAFVEMFE